MASFVLKTLFIGLLGAVLVQPFASLGYTVDEGQCRCIPKRIHCKQNVVYFNFQATFSKKTLTCFPGMRLCCDGKKTDTEFSGRSGHFVRGFVVKIPEFLANLHSNIQSSFADSRPTSERSRTGDAAVKIHFPYEVKVTGESNTIVDVNHDGNGRISVVATKTPVEMPTKSFVKTKIKISSVDNLQNKIVSYASLNFDNLRKEESFSIGDTISVSKSSRTIGDNDSVHRELFSSQFASVKVDDIVSKSLFQSFTTMTPVAMVSESSRNLIDSHFGVSSSSVSTMMHGLTKMQTKLTDDTPLVKVQKISFSREKNNSSLETTSLISMETQKSAAFVLALEHEFYQSLSTVAPKFAVNPILQTLSPIVVDVIQSVIDDQYDFDGPSDVLVSEVPHDGAELFHKYRHNFLPVTTIYNMTATNFGLENPLIHFNIDNESKVGFETPELSSTYSTLHPETPSANQETIHDKHIGLETISVFKSVEKLRNPGDSTQFCQAAVCSLSAVHSSVVTSILGLPEASEFLLDANINSIKYFRDTAALSTLAIHTRTQSLEHLDDKLSMEILSTNRTFQLSTEMHQVPFTTNNGRMDSLNKSSLNDFTRPVTYVSSVHFSSGGSTLPVTKSKTGTVKMATSSVKDNIGLGFTSVTISSSTLPKEWNFSADRSAFHTLEPSMNTETDMVTESVKHDYMEGIHRGCRDSCDPTPHFSEFSKNVISEKTSRPGNMKSVTLLNANTHVPDKVVDIPSTILSITTEPLPTASLNSFSETVAETKFSRDQHKKSYRNWTSNTTYFYSTETYGVSYVVNEAIQSSFGKRIGPSLQSKLDVKDLKFPVTYISIWPHKPMSAYKTNTDFTSVLLDTSSSNASVPNISFTTGSTKGLENSSPLLTYINSVTIIASSLYLESGSRIENDRVGENLATQILKPVESDIAISTRNIAMSKPFFKSPVYSTVNAVVKTRPNAIRGTRVSHSHKGSALYSKPSSESERKFNAYLQSIREEYRNKTLAEQRNGGFLGWIFG